MITHIDLFSGIGGFALAADWTWGKENVNHVFCEIEPFAQKVLKKHWPDAPIHDDIKTLNIDKIVSLLYGSKNQTMGGLQMAKKKAKYNQAVDLYNKGMSVGECGEFYGISRQAMHDILKRRGCEFRSQLKFGEENHFYRGGKTDGTKPAQHLVEKAIKKGVLEQKHQCEECDARGTFQDGRSGIQAHHDDYSKPLDVRWLCQRCHHEWHKNNQPKGENGEAIGRGTTILTGGFP